MTENRNLKALGMIVVYATIIGFTDNFVKVIADQAGLWQFHATRTVMAVALLWAVARPLGLRLGMVVPRMVVARSFIHGCAMVIYFGALGFLPVALVAAGLFTAPIFVLLIERLFYGAPISALGALAVALGFAGVVMVLGPEAFAGASLPALLPVIAGALYAMGNIATRRWCPQESAETLLAGFFIALGIAGAIGMVVLSLHPLIVPAGPEGFLLRGPVVPTGAFWFWTFVQAAGSLLGVGLMVRAYQIAEASRVSVMEYVILPASAAWTWVLWGEGLSPLAVAGMALIVAAGVLISVTKRA
ncbi:DMT family transporter [Stagnihabitans tardus]|uniref:EamA/RhaT family transporter n=1 Tax=Stagnihabitans tardus TaxID=2699202 RepID=A0AAE4YBJ2_9RHOB|nr:DMT family transporter [Stagnihabitans tardus]NBZ88346.1 EamA/RhaT family transporter [Stagnihabitans tardus]